VRVWLESVGRGGAEESSGAKNELPAPLYKML